MGLIRDIQKFWKSTADEHISAFAAQSAFFLFLSFFPLMNIFIALPKFLPFSEQQVLDVIAYVLPGEFEVYITTLVEEMYNNSNSITIISIIVALWSAAKGFIALKRGLSEVYRSRETRNYFIIRGISVLYTIVFIAILIILIPLNMFGTQIAMFILSKFPNFTNLTLLVYSLRNTAAFILLLISFTLMYTIIPSKKLKLTKQLPGALFAAFTWVALTRLISFYVDYYAANSYMYGSLTTVIMIMFWLYFCFYLVFIGAEINEYMHLCRKNAILYGVRRFDVGEAELQTDSTAAGSVTSDEATDAVAEEASGAPHTQA